MGDLATLAGAGGGLGLLAVVIGYLLTSNRQDRQDYREAITDAERRADAAEARAEALQTALDEARTARRVAEDKAALAERELARYRPGGEP